MAKKIMQVPPEKTFENNTHKSSFSPEPTYVHAIGDRVVYGSHDEAWVVDISDDKKFYKLKLIQHAGVKRHKTCEYAESYQITEWYFVRKYHENQTVIVGEDDTRLNYSQRALTDIIGKMFYFGVDMNPEYQRELVWTDADKVLLIDSVYNHVDIGKFVFVHLQFDANGPTYEILDGKQRVTALMEFYTDQFRYKGLTFSEMSDRDQSHFENFYVSIAELNMPKDKNTLYKYFIKLNTGGKPVDKAQIEKVIGMIHDEE